MRLFLVLLAVLLLAAPVAAAQSPTVTPTAGIEDEDPGVVDDPGDAADEDVGDDDEILQDEIPGDDSDYTNYCTGSDGDYAYYEYCYPSVPNPQEDGQPGAGDGGGKDPDDVAPAGLTGATSPGSLPRTGGEPLILALLGLALISMGAGGRLILGRR